MEVNVTNSSAAFSSNSSDANHGSDALLTFSVLLMSLSTMATIIGNILVVTSILRNSNTRRKLSNRFILSLAFADCCVALLVLPPSISKIHHYFVWPYGATLCKAWVTIDVTFCSASIYNLIGITVDRFYAAYYPIKYASNRSGLMVNLLLVFAWTMPLVISLPMHVDHPPFGNWNSLLYDANGTELTDCMPPVDHKSRGWITHAGVLAFIIPTTLLVIFNGLIWNKMKSWQQKRVGMAKQQTVMERQATIATDHSSLTSHGSRKGRKTSKASGAAHDFTNESSSFIEEDGPTTEEMALDAKDIEELKNYGSDKVINRIFSSKKKKDLTRAEKKLRKEQAAQKKITTMMSVVIGTFILCWSPFAIMFILFPFSFGDPENMGMGNGLSDWLVLHPAAIEFITWIGYVNSFLNPMIYTLMNTEIRNGIKAIFSDLKKLLKV